MGGNIRFRTAQSVRGTQAKNAINDFLNTASTNHPKIINANYMSTLISATKKRDRKKVIATDNSAKSNYLNSPEVLKKYVQARNAIIKMSQSDLNKFFTDEWDLMQKWAK